jgi:hypothetical protein
LGPYDKQKKLTIPILSSYSVNEFIEGNDGYIFSAGAPVWGLDWCPTLISESEGMDGALVYSVSLVQIYLLHRTVM